MRPPAAADVVAAVREVLDARAGACVEEHAKIGREVAEVLGGRGMLAPPVAVELGGALVEALETGPTLGVWIDDPPEIVLSGTYLARLLGEAPISEVAVMLDGPHPGLSDQRWDWRELERLRKRLPPHVRRILTAWIAPKASAVDELAGAVPRLIEALGAHGFELDAEPAGGWREAQVRGYLDANRDRRRLDDAAAAIGDFMAALDVEDLEVTTFPGALRAVAVLVEEIARRARPDQRVRYLSQDYAVRHRGSKSAPILVEWASALGPLRLPLEARAKARATLPASVVLGTGLAAYDHSFPQGDALEKSVEVARADGADLFRIWSGKWIARKPGASARRAILARAFG